MLHNSGVNTHHKSCLEILLIEDNPGDVRLLEDVFIDYKNEMHLSTVPDGVKALDYLYKKGVYILRPTPDIILLDLNIPKKSGREILTTLKNDPNLKKIPVIILTVSQAEDDIVQCYNLHANAYITKPFSIDKLMNLVKALKLFWFDVVTLVPKGNKKDD